MLITDDFLQRLDRDLDELTRPKEVGNEYQSVPIYQRVKGDLVTIDPKICSWHEDRYFTCKRRQDLRHVAKVKHSFTLAM